MTLRDSDQIDTQAATQARIMSWVTANHVGRAIRSRYGRKDIQVSTASISNPRAWNTTVDADAVKEVSSEIATIKRRKLELEPLMQENTQLNSDKRDERDSVKEKIVCEPYVDRYTRAT